MSEKMKEKRKEPRIDVNIPLRYKELHGTADVTRGTLTRNLSAGGVKFSAASFVPLSCPLVVEVNLPRTSKPIRIVSKVVWIKKLPAGEDYEIGGKFLNIASTDREAIANYVQIPEASDTYNSL